MRIALVTNSFWPKMGGAEYVVHDLATNLHDAGHEVFVFAPKVEESYQEIDHRYGLVRSSFWPDRSYQLRIRSRLKRVFLRTGLSRPLTGLLSQETGFLNAFHRLHKARRFDVINAHSAHKSSSWAHQLRHRYGVPVVITCHGGDVQSHAEVGYGSRLRPEFDEVIRQNLLEAERVVAISGSMYEELAKLVPLDRIVRIPDGVEVMPLPHLGPVLPEDVHEDGGIVILSVGRNVPVKSFDCGLRAFAAFSKRVKGAHYVHIGRDSESLNDLAKALGIGERFHALGECDRSVVRRAYMEADVFFSPSVMEAFPLVNIEAMAAGLPCVVTDGAGNGDSTVHGKNGWIVPVGNAEAMAAALEDLALNEERRRAFGEASQRIVEQYRWDKVSNRYIEVFAEVAGAKVGEVP